MAICKVEIQFPNDTRKQFYDAMHDLYCRDLFKVDEVANGAMLVLKFDDKHARLLFSIGVLYGRSVAKDEKKGKPPKKLVHKEPELPKRCKDCQIVLVHDFKNKNYNVSKLSNCMCVVCRNKFQLKLDAENDARRESAEKNKKARFSPNKNAIEEMRQQETQSTEIKDKPQIKFKIKW